MNRLLLPALALLSAATPLVVDSALKGAALMSAALLGALLLWRASAAARHLVWLVAVLALLAVPLLSLVLPGWRVLPAWAVASAVAAPAAEKDLSYKPYEPHRLIPAAPRDSPSLAANLEPSPETPAPAAIPAAEPPPAAPPVALAPAVPWWRTALPFLWSAGCAVLLLRLFGAHWLLRRAARRAQAVTDGPLAAALAAVASQLGVMQRVRLLVEEKRTIPLVWGVWRPRLMLPAEALTWDTGQLQSVLLHELAHIRRRDTLVQWLTQLACALHWFNPLVWLAAWRLHVERERACDDMVLASGVKPSTYAEHLLHIASQLSPARWTSACGLAMARKSALEGRLLAVLSEKLNRRGVTSALAAIALILGAGIAIPVAMLRAADEKWNPPSGAHVGGNDFSTFCIHDGKDASFVIAYQGDFDSSSRSSSNAKARTWNNDVTLTAKKPGIALSFLRTHDAPGKLSITTAPAESRDLSKPEPAPRNFGQKEYDLTKGRVFLLTDSGLVRQLDLPTPIVTYQESSKRLAALIAAIPPQQWESDTPMKIVGKLAPETITKLKWGEPVNGLRMALAWPPSFDDEMLGKKPHFELVVQNVSEKEIHLKAGDEAPNPRKMFIRNGDRIELALSDGGVLAVDCRLQPGHCCVLRLFANEERDKAKAIPSSAIESDLSKLGLFHAIVKMEIAKAPEGAWTGELVTGPTRGSADMAAAPAPKHKDARALYEIWQQHARLSGDIPGALIGELAAAVKVFIGYNPTWETVPKLKEILPRLDATHDWKAADAIALLDEVAAVQDSPLQTAAEKMTASTISQGKALPEKFANVAWGETQVNALRAAWVLEPGVEEHRMGTALKARLLVQNMGKLPVMVRVPTWHQGSVKARDERSDAKSAEIEVSGIEWTTMARLVPVRLAPGEFIEINAPGVGLGKDAGRGPWAGPRVGSNVLAKDGTELTLTHGPIPLDGSGVGMREDAPHLIGPGWWQAHIKARLARELPLPATGAKRTHLLDRAVRELFATTPSADEIDAFATDRTDSAFDSLVQRLAARADVVEFSASLPTAPVKFRVLPADPASDKTPRVVLGPGEYPLSAGTAEYGAVTLKIVGKPVGDRRTNDAQLLFEPTEFTGILPPDPHKLEVPDGWGTWAIVCRPSDGFFCILHKGGVRKIDYSAPRKVTDTPATDLPAGFRDEVKRQFDIAGVPAESQAEVFEKPAAPAESPAPTPRIRGKVLKSDGSPAVGVEVRVDDGIERWKFRGPAFPDLPRPVKTADDGTFSIDVPKGAVAENYEVFASNDDFAPLNARVPTGGNVGMMQFEKGSRVTGRVIGLDGAGLAKVGIWCKRLDWRGRGPAPTKLTSTGADGTFSIPPIAMGRHVLRIITRDLGAKELAVAFANQVIEAKDDAPVELEIRPLPTVELSFDARVTRANAEFRDFEVRVSGTLPGTKAGDPAAYWTRQETTKLAEGKHTIAVPAGLQNTSIRAGGIYMRKGDAPVFIWQRGSDAQPATTSIIELGIMDKPQTISVTVRDAQQEENLEKPAPPATTPEPKSAEAGAHADDAALQPKHESAQKLLKSWQPYARSDGKIPGGLIDQLAEQIESFIKQTPEGKDTVALGLQLARCYTTQKRPPFLSAGASYPPPYDWTPEDAVTLLDDISDISTAPVSWANSAMEFDKARAVQAGKPLPKQLESAAWGAPTENGLRAAWLLEPVSMMGTLSTSPAALFVPDHRLGSVLKARVLFHNAGKVPVVFQTETWHQNDGHKALDAKGAEIPVKATWFTGITPLATFRLAPGEYCEVSGHGIAIGAGEYKDEHSTGAIGAVIEAKEGDAITLTHTVDAAHGNGPKKPAELRKQIIAERVNREAPMPRAAADRELLIRRVTLDLTGVAPTTEEVAAFTADEAPDALANLIARLQATAAEVPWSGKLPTGETKFRVISADPNAAKAPRTATAPGRYVLGDGVHLQVRQVTEGDKRTNSAEIIFFSPDPKKESPHKPYPIGFYVPDSAYAFVWERGANTLWVTEISEGEPIRPWLLGSPERPGPQKVTVRAFDFSNPADVKLTHVSCNENGGDWSWGKIVPVAFHQPVLNALGERGKRLRDFLPAGESRKLDRAMLHGIWEGEKDGATVKVEFQWLSEHQQVRWEVKRPSSSIGAQMSVVIAVDGNSAEFIFRKGLEFEATQGRLTPGEGGTMNLEIIPNPNLSDPGYPALKGLILKPQPTAAADDAPKTSDARPRQKIDWSKGPSWNGLSQPFDPAKALALAEAVKKSDGDIDDDRRRLMFMILKATAERAPELRPLLEDKELRHKDDDFQSFALALAAYDFAVNGNKNGLQFILDTLASGPAGDVQAAVPLGFIDEWDLSVAAHEKHFDRGSDGAAGEARMMFWKERKFFFPEGLARFQKAALAAIKLDTESLNGTWQGTKDGVTVELRLGKEQRWKVRRGDNLLKADLISRPAETGKFIILIEPSETGRQAPRGKLTRGEDGQLHLEVWPQSGANRPYPSVTDIVLEKQVVEPAAKAAGGAKLTPDALLGSWRGTVNGEKLMLSFHRPPTEKDVQLDVYFGEATIGAEASFTIAEDGVSAEVVQHTVGGGMKFGTLVPGDEGRLKLELYGRQKGQQETILTRDAEAVATEPQQAEARALFEFWRRQADDVEEGAIPYWLVDRLADEVRAFVHANPNLDSAAKLESLLPRFATSVYQSLPLIDAKELLNDVAYYSTKPMEAYLAREQRLEKLTGSWEGKVNGRAASLWIGRRSPVSDDICMELRFPAEGEFETLHYGAALDGIAFKLGLAQADGRPTPFGLLVPVTGESLKLTLLGKEEVFILTRKIEPQPTEPTEQAARELFEMWKTTANADGTIPGTLIGMLATEMRAFGKAHAGRVHADNIVKLLPQFVTSRDWTQEEAIKLLDAVAYFATDPIAARLTKAKLPRGPLWRTMVEFQDIPVQIEKWSEPLRGLRIGMRIVEADWRIGGKMRAELWLHNAGENDVIIQTTGPDRQDAGVIVSAVGADGIEHSAHSGSSRILTGPEACTLPAGHIVLTKTFEVKFFGPENNAAVWSAPEFHGLPAGKYKLRCSWSDSSGLYEGKEWRGSLTAPELEFTLAAQTAEALPPAAASEYVTVTIAKDGALSYERKAVTLAELKTMAAENAKKWFTIRADEDVPYARAVEVLDTLRVAGVAEITFSEGRMGDGRYRIANRTGNYDFDATHKFSICMPRGQQQWFTVIWPAKDGRPARRLRFYPELSAEGRTPWAVAWEPNANVLWWVDASYVGRMTLADPGAVIVTREGRMAASSPGLTLPEEVRTQFRSLGRVVGQIGQTGPDTSAPISSQETLVAEVLKADGTAVDHPQVRPGGEWSEAWRELSATVAAARGTPEAELESLIAWGDTKDGLRSGVLMIDRVKRGGRTEARLVVRNVSDKSMTVNLSPVPNQIDVEAKAVDGTRLQVHKVVLFGTDPAFSYTFKPGHQLEFAAPPIQFGVERNADGKVQTPDFPVCGVETGPGTVSVRYSLTNVHAPDSGEVKVVIE